MIRRNFDKKFKGVRMRSGHIYNFRYTAWREDPRPVIILLYHLEGIHPNTGREWRFFQGINFSYIPRSQRRAFARDWVNTFNASNGNTRFTWETVQRRYPYLQHAVRRYFSRPDYYITKLVEIPPEKMEKAITSTWSKDFSKKIFKELISKGRSALGRSRARRR